MTVRVDCLFWGMCALLLAGSVRADAERLRVSAADSRAEAKAAADFVCTGTNDEAVLQRAIDLCRENGKQLFLFSGLYRLGSVRDFGDGGPRAAVCIRNMHRAFSMVGERRQITGWPKGMAANGAVLYLQPEALEAAGGKSVDILRGEWSERGIMNGSALELENVAVFAPDSHHALRAIDLQRVNSVEIRNVVMRAFGTAVLNGLTYPYGNPPPPHPESIGMTLTDGSNNAPVNLLNVSACGFGQGFQVGGEHVVMVNCSATFGGYGFTFGNYPYHCAFNHPITLVNCCDEQNVNLPLFASCGDNGGRLHGRQEVTMVSFNCERVAEHAPGGNLGDLMRETRPGTWRGTIGFTRQPRWNAVNSVDEPIWAADGSGSGFVTRNNAHRPACGTAERLSYCPQHMQQVYDTDLNKLLVCTDPVRRIWRDALGNAVDALDFVDPLIGTEGAGSQYGGMQPCVTVPFGSFHAVPMTRTNAIGRLSYNAADGTLLGIILTRQPAIWMGDWGEVRIPVPPAKIEKLVATPYLTRITAGGRTYELAATAHAAWIRGLDAATVAAFPASGVSTNRMDAKYGYPLHDFGGRWFADKTRPGELRIGLSLISVDQARDNLAREIGPRTFDAVVAETRGLWTELFSRVEIDAPADVKTIFYTGLYHTLLYPRRMDEAGRYYSAFDDRVHRGVRYNCFSLWDTYRAEHPWLTLIAPERVDGMMQSLVDMSREGGWLPKWPNPSYTGIMIGAPAEVVLAEACAKGFRGFDLNAAWEAVRKNAFVPQAGDDACDWRDRGEFGRAPETRGGLKSYLARGYVACDLTRESVSRTQDFGLADAAAAVLADAAGHRTEAAALRARSRNFTNLWDAASGCFLPRRRDGTFKREVLASKDRHYGDYCEQAPHTAVWCIQHDVETLVTLMGGKAAAERRLDEFFAKRFWVPERGNKSIHGNEPSHHVAYLYNRFGAPEKTQRTVREILTRSYSANRKGFDGNEDCGQMSAWYIFSSLGFYPLDPAGGFYELGSPLVKSATLKLGAATLRIVAKDAAPGRWRVRRVTLNGRELADWRVSHAELVRGGELVFEMCD